MTTADLRAHAERLRALASDLAAPDSDRLAAARQLSG